MIVSVQCHAVLFVCWWPHVVAADPPEHMRGLVQDSRGMPCNSRDELLQPGADKTHCQQGHIK